MVGFDATIGDEKMKYYERDDRTISYSEITKYMACPREWMYSYMWGLKPIIPIPRLRLGSLVDAGIEAAIRANDSGSDVDGCITAANQMISAAWDEYRGYKLVAGIFEINPEVEEEGRQTARDATLIAARAVRSLGLGRGRWKSAEVDGEPLIQFELIHPIGNGHTFRGFIDWCAIDLEDDSDDVVLIDVKTREKMSKAEDMDFDYQLPLYAHVLREKHGVEVDFHAHFQVRAKVPPKPRQNKNGKLSKAKVDTTKEAFFSEVKRLRLDPEEYDSMTFPEFDVLTYRYRSARECRKTYENAGIIANQIIRAEAEYRAELECAPRRLHIMQCRMCSRQRLCLADMNGHDLDPILSNYTTKEQRKEMQNENSQ